MSNIPGAQPLFRFERGMQLTADALNCNFMLLYGMIESVAAKAYADNPDALMALEEAHDACERVLQMEEHFLAEAKRARHSHYAPLTLVAELAQQIQEVAGPVLHSMARLQAADERRGTGVNDLASRVAALEIRPAPPPAASPEDVQQLSDAVTRSRSAADIALRNTLEAKNEIGELRRQAQANATGEASQRQLMLMLRELMRRVEALERR